MNTFIDMYDVEHGNYLNFGQSRKPVSIRPRYVTVDEQYSPHSCISVFIYICINNRYTRISLWHSAIRLHEYIHTCMYIHYTYDLIAHILRRAT